jgi:hypothetical protein
MNWDRFQLFSIAESESDSKRTRAYERQPDPSDDKLFAVYSGSILSSLKYGPKDSATVLQELAQNPDPDFPAPTPIQLSSLLGRLQQSGLITIRIENGRDLLKRA